jgi:hypothetical protein
MFFSRGGVQNLLFSHLLSKSIKIKIYKIIILPVGLYRCETWSLILREEHRLKVFEDSVLRKMFGPERNKVTGGSRKLHDEEFHNFYSSRSKIRMIKSRKMRRTGHVARTGRRGMHVGYWLEHQMKRDDWEDQDVGGWTILK